MAVTVYGVEPLTWDPRVDLLDARALLKIAMEGAQAVSNAPTPADNVLARIATKRQALGWDIDVSAKTTAAETATVLDLTAAGVTFPAGFMRLIDVEVYASGQAADETGASRYTFSVSGGTTPIVRAGTLFTATPATMQVGGTYQAMAGAGLAGTPAVSITLATNNVILQVTSAEAEILNFFLRVKVGRLQPLILGV